MFILFLDDKGLAYESRRFSMYFLHVLYCSVLVVHIPWSVCLAGRPVLAFLALVHDMRHQHSGGAKLSVV